LIKRCAVSARLNLSHLEVSVKLLGLLLLLFGFSIVIASLMILYDDLPWSRLLLTYAVTLGGILVFLGYKGLRFKERDSPEIIYDA